MSDKLRDNSISRCAESDCAPIEVVDAHSSPADSDLRHRREFLGKSGKLLIYVPPVIQLFIPTKALAASPSS